MAYNREVELIDKLHVLWFFRTYIFDDSNSDSIKHTIPYKLFCRIVDESYENLDLKDIPIEDFRLKSIEYSQNLKKDFPRIASILLKYLNNINVADIMNHYNQIAENSSIIKMVSDYETELINKNKGKFYTVNEAIKILGYSHKASIYHHINNNHLVVNKLSERKTIIYEKDLDAFTKKTYKKSLIEYMRLSLDDKKALHKN